MIHRNTSKLSYAHCLQSYCNEFECRLTIEGEIAEKCRDEVKQEAEADADVCYVLHPLLSWSEKQQNTFTKQIVIKGVNNLPY